MGLDLTLSIEKPIICKKCNHCGEKINSEEECAFIVNEGFDDEYYSCEGCHLSGFDDDIATQCEQCGQWFYPKHLLVNEENKETEICPYCGEVWLE